MGYIVGIDTGGTFTDLVAVAEDGTVKVAKHPSTPAAPMEAFTAVLAKSGVPYPDITRIVLGTTVATNAVITRRGARVALVATRGFEDIPFIQRLNRKKEYDLQWLKPTPLVKRRDCLAVVERVDAKGQVVAPLTDETLTSLGDAIQARRGPDGIEAVAVCLLFAYVNPVHELRVGRYLRERFPDLPVSLSHEVAPIWREYERTSTVLADAYVKPLLQRYCGSIERALKENRVPGPCSILKSNGGMTLLDNATDHSVDILLSGLAGGIVGGRYFANVSGYPNAITLDMGGTSADVGLIVNGHQRFTTEFEIEWGLPVAVPIMEVRTLGAGGGSLAWIDKGGMLNVGPQSAGAVPGPACYGSGNEDLTVTDANLVLGRLNPSYFLGGEMTLRPELAEKAADRLAARMGLGPAAAALAAVDIADENMTNAIRLLTIDRGLDPRDFALVAFGGAGPLHACAIARKLGLGTVVVPPHPGLCSALGAAISELRVEKVQTFAARHPQVNEVDLNARFAAMVESGLSELKAEGLSGTLRQTFTIAMRYFQQNYEQDVEYQPETGLPGALEAFHRLHQEFYGYHFRDETIELVHLKVSLAEQADRPPIRPHEEPKALERHGARRVVDADGQGRQVPIYRRDHLPAGTVVRGPLVVEEVDSTTFVPSGANLTVNESHCLIITW